jgi:hypothetical protein
MCILLSKHETKDEMRKTWAVWRVRVLFFLKKKIKRLDKTPG